MAVLCDLAPWFCILLSLPVLFRFISRKTSKLPPGPVGLPVVGSLFQLGDMPNESLAALSKQYGPLMTLRLGLRTTVVVSSAAMAEEVLHKHDRDLAGRAVMDAANVLGHPEFSILLNQNCPLRWELRRICKNELFTPKKLDAKRGLREEKAWELLKHIHTASAAGHPVDIGQCIFSTDLNLMSNTVFSEDVADLESEFAGEFKSLMSEISEVALKPNVVDYFPMLRLVDPQGLRRRFKTVVKQLYDFLDELIEKRLQSHVASAEGWKRESEDFLDVLLRLAENPGSGFTRQNINPLLADLFFAGTESSSSAVEWAMAELLRHPDKMAAAQSELKRTIGTARVVEESDIPRLHYLQAVVKETLRLHPPAPLLPHRADVTTQVAGFTIPKHSQVLVNVWAINRDAERWENPSCFSPERFIGSDVDFKGKNFQFIPFGAGSRMCVGMPLALRVVHLLLASLLHAFSWNLPQGIEPEKFDVAPKFGATLKKASPLIVFPSPLLEM